MADAGSETTTPAPTASGAATSSSAGPTFLVQAQDPSPDQGQPGDKPPAPAPQPPQGEPPKPQENGGEDGNEGEEQAPPDESAYAALKVGEGLVADEAALGDFKKLAAEARLPVETAQKILDLHGQMQAAAMRGWQSTVQGWRQQTEADPYLAGGDIPGGGFASLKDAGQAAGRFMAHYGDSELRQALDQYGLGDHPALVRAIAKAGRDLASDQLHAGAGRPRVDPNRVRYPTMSDEFFSH
jgi:hypothetical protein